MKRTNLRASMLCLPTILAASFVFAQNLPVDLAGNISGFTPSVRLTKLINSSLKSQSGESLGQIQDLILDPVTGQVQFAVVSTGASDNLSGGSSRTTGIGTTSGTTAVGEFVAIPWRLVSSSGQGQFTARVDRAKLQSAPTFSSSSWPTVDAAWIQGVNSHYGLGGVGTGRPGNNSGTGTGIGNPSTHGSIGTPRTPVAGSPDGSRPSPGTTPNSGAGTGTGAGGGASGGAGSGGGK